MKFSSVLVVLLLSVVGFATAGCTAWEEDLGVVGGTHETSGVAAPQAVQAPSFKLPVQGGRSWYITQGALTTSSHKGLYALDVDDLALGSNGKPVAVPGAPVLASAAGKVIEAGGTSERFTNIASCPSGKRSNGYYVKIQHDGGFVTAYLHFASAPLVTVNTWVVAGQQLGVIGTTGCSTGTHVHFEVQNPTTPSLLAGVVVEGKLMTSYKVGYYPSTNTAQTTSGGGQVGFTVAHPSSSLQFKGVWDKANTVKLFNFKCYYFGGVTQMMVSGTAYRGFTGQQAGADCVFTGGIDAQNNVIAFAPPGQSMWYYFTAADSCAAIVNNNGWLQLKFNC